MSDQNPEQRSAVGEYLTLMDLMGMDTRMLTTAVKVGLVQEHHQQQLESKEGDDK